jgi:septum formation protein
VFARLPRRTARQYEPSAHPGAIIGAMSVQPDPAARPARLVLASASPRRRRLFEWYDVPFSVCVTDVDETLDPALADDPRAQASDIAERKSLAAIAAGFADDVVIGCDTIVVLDGEVLGKPVDLQDAHRMLHALSGRAHQVVTGVAIAAPGLESPVLLSVTTNVNMHELTDAMIDAWASEGQMMGCAGAYNIERHLAWVEDDECYQNVAGLPLCHLYLLLATIAEPLLGTEIGRPDATCDATRGAFCKIGPCMLGRCC